MSRSSRDTPGCARSWRRWRSSTAERDCGRSRGIGVSSFEADHPAPHEENARMTYVITEPCIGVKDASCVDVCPVDCIHATDEDSMFFIDPDECIDCGACEPECPVTAIFAEDAVPDQWANYTQIN